MVRQVRIVSKEIRLYKVWQEVLLTKGIVISRRMCYNMEHPQLGGTRNNE